MMKIYIINLDRDIDRLNHIASRFNELGLTYERVAATDGRALAPEKARDFASGRPLHASTWLPGQIGCFLSHFAVWQKIASAEEAYALICEDDIHLADAMREVRTDTHLPSDFDIIRLEASTNRLLLNKNAAGRIAGRNLYRLKSTSWCGGAYILSREAARRIVMLPIDQHNTVDAFLFSHELSPVARNLLVYQVDPALAVQDKYLPQSLGRSSFVSNIEIGGSDEGKERSIWRLIKKATPSGMLRTLLGYKYIHYAG